MSEALKDAPKAALGQTIGRSTRSIRSVVRPLSANQIVQIWEHGASQHPLDRALLCLAWGCPEVPIPDLAQLPLGIRDAALLTLRELTFGPRMDSQANCPQCGELLEFSLNVSDIRVVDLDRSISECDSGAADGLHRPSPHQLHTENLDLTFRLPTSLDLAAIATIPPPEARTQLAHRCLLHAKQAGQPLTAEAIPAEAIAHLSRHLADADPQAEILLDFQCPACQHPWQSLFDIVEFFWSELQAQAQQILREVHVLARAYGWREMDILALSSTRRQFYLDLVS